jgi:hypothetical protein
MDKMLAEIVEQLAKKAVERSASAVEALQLSQAALNVANARLALK